MFGKANYSVALYFTKLELVGSSTKYDAVEQDDPLVVLLVLEGPSGSL